MLKLESPFCTASSRKLKFTNAIIRSKRTLDVMTYKNLKLQLTMQKNLQKEKDIMYLIYRKFVDIVNGKTDKIVKHKTMIDTMTMNL